MSDPKEFAFGSLREFAVPVPVFGTAIAITYDVGFFWGLDINYFTLFSLTEHIVFAIEALPLALGLSFVLAVLFVTVQAANQRYDQRSKEAIERETSTLNPQQKVEWYQQKVARHRRTSWLLGSTALASIFVAWLSRTLLSLFVFSFCVALFTIGLTINTLFFSSMRYSPSFLATYAVIVSLLITFTIGIDVQQRFVHGGKVAHAISLENIELRGRIVRAGERGLLFYDPGSREISFVPWETVKRIRTVPQP